MENQIKAYKGFKHDMTCRGFQYEVGKEYEHDGKVEACVSGFHACENPLDVLSYYPPCDENGNPNRYCEVEQGGYLDRSEDDKICSSHLRVKAEIGLTGLINAGVKFILDRVKSEGKENATGYRSAATNTGDYSAATNTGDWSAATNTGDYSAATNTGDYSAATNTGDWSAATNTGYRSAATNTGDYSAATNTGDWSADTNTGYRSAATNTGDYSAATNTGNRSAATNTGYRSAATNTGYRSAATNTGDYSAATNTGNRSAASVEGKDSIAIVTGRNSKAKGALGCWIVLTERNSDYEIVEVKAAKVDGKQIKPDTWYRLHDGQFVEVEE